MSPAIPKSGLWTLILFQVIGACCCWMDWSPCEGSACGASDIACLVAAEDDCEDHLTCCPGIPPRVLPVRIDLAMAPVFACDMLASPVFKPLRAACSLRGGSDPPDRITILRC